MEGMQTSDMLSSQVDIDTGVKTLIPTLANSLSSKWGRMFACGSAFVSGVLLILLVEALFIMFFIMRSIEKKPQRVSTPHTSSISVEVPDNSLLFSLQGGVWVAALPAGDVKKMYTKREKALKEKAAKEQKTDQDVSSSKDKSKKDALKDYIHVAPVWRYAKLQGRILHLSCQRERVKESIVLEGCEIEAVSGSAFPTRKWAKKYPLKLHNANRHIYGGSHNCLLYLETGWEKEAWCEVLRASAKWENDADRWYFNLKKEYQEYLIRVENQFPFLTRGNPGSSWNHTIEEKLKIPKIDAATNNKKSKLLWKKLTRRSIKVNRDNKSGEREEARRASSDDAEDGSSRGASIANLANAIMVRTGSLENLSSRDMVGPDESQKVRRLVSTKSSVDIPSAAVERDTSELPQSEHLERSLLCANQLFARLFFDLYHSEYVVTRIRNLLQRQVAKVPTPSYIGKINCTHLDLGNSPPLAQNVRLLPMESDGGWGLEADVQYYGGAILTIETRIDVRDSNAREKVVVQGLQETLAGAATADLLTKGLENLKTDFRIAVDEGGTGADQRNAGGTSTSSRPAEVRVSEEGSRKGWMQSSITNVKQLMSRVAEQVSQVPLALTIRVAQIKGTLQVRIKPPPSDRVWFSFTEMPTLELLPEPCIGDHKINSGPLGALIVNQLKILIRDSMVSPQCEDLSYSWMMSEAGNWISRDVVPLAFVPDQVQSDQSNYKERRETQVRREGSIDNNRIDASGVGPSNSLPGTPSQYSHENLGSPPVSPSKVSLASSLSLPVSPSARDPLNDLTMPLLGEGEKEDLGLEESHRVSDSVTVDFTEPLPQVLNAQTQTASSSDSDTGPMKSEEAILLGKQPSVEAGKREKVFTFGKKMGTKLAEKRRIYLERRRDRSQQNSDVPNV